LNQVFTNDKNEECVKLTSLYLFAKNVRSLLHTYHYQQIFLHDFSMAYAKYVGETLQPKTYGYSSVEELLGAIPQVGILLSFMESIFLKSQRLTFEHNIEASRVTNWQAF
jgi:hypothetical protein